MDVAWMETSRTHLSREGRSHVQVIPFLQTFDRSFYLENMWLNNDRAVVAEEWKELFRRHFKW